MADNKRQSMGSKAQNQSATGSGPAHMPSQETLIKAIGARIRITTAAPNTATIEGVLYTACPVTHLVAINTSNQTPSSSTNLNQPGDYHIIPASRIQSFEVLSPATAVVDGSSSIQVLETRALKAREAAAIAKLQEAEARRGKGVTREAQDIFDAFSRTMPARWDGTSIVVADAVVIDKPYRVDDCRALIARDAAALTRVRKVLEMERKKIELRNASATIGNSNQFTRQNRDRVAIPSRFDNSPAPVPRKGG